MVPHAALIKTHCTLKNGARVVQPVHGLRKAEPDPQFEPDIAAHLREQLTRAWK
jgi:hypothetical protein